MKIKAAFVCTHNSCRSQMAEGWAKALGPDILDAYSAGTEKYPEIKPLAVKAMGEAGVDITGQHPKLTNEIPQELDYLITMGCGVQCPYIPSKHVEDWGVEDPSGKGIGEFRKTRDIIREKVEELIETVSRGK